MTLLHFHLALFLLRQPNTTPTMPHLQLINRGAVMTGLRAIDTVWDVNNNQAAVNLELIPHRIVERTFRDVSFSIPLVILVVKSCQVRFHLAANVSS